MAEVLLETPSLSSRAPGQRKALATALRPALPPRRSGSRVLVARMPGEQILNASCINIHIYI